MLGLLLSGLSFASEIVAWANRISIRKIIRIAYAQVAL
jgi:hypothetical protein